MTNTETHSNEEVQNLDRCISAYKVQLEQGDMQKTYRFLLQYVMQLKAKCETHIEGDFSFGNISPGYMDYTYFPFYDTYLRERKLRVGVVLNHRDMRFELWLMGQNAAVQKDYWDRLKDSSWNVGRKEMPKYSVLEAILVQNPNFQDLEKLTKDIIESVSKTSSAVIQQLRLVS
jgi:hypothetical protein